jgi:hypothetical protein
MHVRCRPRTILGVLLRSAFQLVLTFAFGLLIYSAITYFANQREYEKEYFPFGSGWEDDLSKSNEFRLKIADGYLQNAQLPNFEVSTDYFKFFVPY